MTTTSIFALSAAAIMTVTRFVGGEAIVPEAVFGERVHGLERSTIAIDAAYAFETADMNGDGVVDGDEYAANMLVTAELVRFNGVVAIHGEEQSYIPVTKDTADAIRPGERDQILGQAEIEYELITAGADGLSKDMWMSARLARFNQADWNSDGVLKGDELKPFAELIAMSGRAEG